MISSWLTFSDYISISVAEQRVLKSLHRRPLFLFGLILRLLLVLLAFPINQQQWFLPFMTQGISAFTLNAWHTHLSNNGNVLAFPYGVVMYLAYFPLTCLGWSLDQLLQVSWFAKVGFGLTSLAFDYALLVGIALLVRQYSQQLLLLTYWCSPVVIYILYWHGQLDVVPVFLLIFGVCALQWSRPILSGTALGFAVSSKLSMLVSVPFILIYLYRNARLRDQLWALVGAMTVSLALTIAPALSSAAFVEMVMRSREIERIYSLYLSYGSGLRLFLLPVVYILSLYLIWRLERITLDLFVISIGLGFFVLLLLLPPATGWFLWIMPFLTFYQLRSRRDYFWITFPFFGLYLSYSFFYATGADIPFLRLSLSHPLAIGTPLASTITHSIFFTVLQAFGLLICVRMYSFGIRRNSYYRMSRRPFTLGLSGDIGVGKSVLVTALTDLFGTRAVSTLSGDDYHKWKRHHPMWSTRTHRNPNATNLSQLTRDVSSLVLGQPVGESSGERSHEKFAKANKLPSRDFVIVSGLHTLYLKRLRQQLDLKIFLDVDEDLRSYWYAHQTQAEVRVHQNNQVVTPESINNQQSNQRFIHSQAQYADLLFKLAPVNPERLNDFSRSPRLKLSVRMENGFFHEDLVRSLVALCGMHIDVEQSEHLDLVTLYMEGDADRDDIAEIARLLVPNLEDLIVRRPQWRHSCTGLMQVIVLAHISDRLHRGRTHSYA